MAHKVKVTVIDKKLYPELQQQYCADPQAGACPVYNVGDEFVFEREGGRDHFWGCGLGTLRRTFIFDEDGLLERIIEKVDTKNAAGQIL